jgi:proteasome-associated ATPase
MPSTPATEHLDLILDPHIDMPARDRKQMLTDWLAGNDPAALAPVVLDFHRQLNETHRRLHEAGRNAEALAEMVDKLTTAPWFPATFLEPLEGADVPTALVQQGNGIRAVAVDPDIDADALLRGQRVYLNSEQNIVLSAPPAAHHSVGETAVFDRRENGSLVARARDEEILLKPAGNLPVDALQAGDLLSFDRSSWIAFTRIEAADNDSLFLEDAPDTTFDDVGGLDAEVSKMRDAVEMLMCEPEIASAYALPPARGMLLVGPPGTGKTMIARAFASWLRDRTPGKSCPFISIKAGEMNSKWFGETEANWRRVFDAAEKRATANPSGVVVVFIDELDAVASSRSDAGSSVHDRVLPSLLTEIDGLVKRAGNILVIGATNRRDILDTAATRDGRFSDLVLEVGRPNMEGAREIFGKHLPPTVPYDCGTHTTSETARADMISAAVSMIYSPNAAAR